MEAMGVGESGGIRQASKSKSNSYVIIKKYELFY